MRKCALVLLIVVLWAHQVKAEGRFGFGLRAGPSTFTQDVTESASVNGNLGPALNFDLLYAINRYISLGFELEWERHNVDLQFPISDVSLGHISTISLLPCVEVHFIGADTFSPYLFLGLGYNINAFGRSDEFNGVFPFLGVASGTDLGIADAFALKVGIGTDIFLADSFAINVDLGWKYNPGDFNVTRNNVEIASLSTDESVFTALFGFRYYFPSSGKTTSHRR